MLFVHMLLGCALLLRSSLSLSTAENDRATYMESTQLPFRHGVRHLINRSTIYEDVITLYSTAKDIINERPFRVKFVDELAFDIGGVTRDMFSGFYEEAYLKLFDGPSLLTPIDFPNFSTSPLPIFGTVISHAYFVAGILPVKIAYPSLCAMLLGSSANSIPSEVLVQSFVDSLDHHEASIVKNASVIVKTGESTSFPEDVRDGLIDVYSRFQLREIPKPGNFFQLITGIAKFHFLRKPAAAIAEIHSGIPEVHSRFWQKLSIGDFYAIYNALQASPAKVLALLDDESCSNKSEERIFGYLRQYIGNMQPDEIRNFLRFVTGSSVCSSKVISVTFNAVDGLGRRPIGHTCPCMLELSTAYATYLEFVAEFKSILTNEGLAWQMDAI